MVVSLKVIDWTGQRSDERFDDGITCRGGWEQNIASCIYSLAGT